MYKKSHKEELGQENPELIKTKDDPKIKALNSKITGSELADHQSGRDNTIVQPEHLIAGNANQKGAMKNVEKLFKGNQHLGRATPSAEKERWNYETLENVKNNKKKGNAIT